jgi:NitT/TauT family transport system permease protein
MSLLSVADVTLEYRNRNQTLTAAHRITFRVERSDRFVILGPSGCGKSTILKAVGGYVQPIAGSIFLNGKPVLKPGPDRVFVFQEFDQLLPWKTVKENITFALTASRKFDRRVAEQRAMTFVEKVNLTSFAGSYPHTLSGGMKQRVAIARAMAMEPEILLMDEPFAALDALTRSKMQEELLQLCEETKFTVLFVTHSISEAIRIGTRMQRRFTNCCSTANWTKVRAMWNSAVGRKLLLLGILAVAWEVYARWLANPLLLPTFSDTVVALASSISAGRLPRAVLFTISLLLKGYAAGLLLAGLLTAFATTTRVGADLLELLTSMFNPLPSIALLPIALIWFGLGDGSVIFVLIHAVLWSVALNTYAGFRGVSPTLRMVGQNYGLSMPAYIARILVPAAFPSILTGLKIGWAFAWRTLIAAELVFGVSSGSGGLGWYIFENKNQLLIPNVFAGLLTVIFLGLCVEHLIFHTVENATVRRWGMQT